MDGTEFSAAFDPIEVGNLVARLAVNDAEIGAAQALRYRVFYEEMSAHPSAEVEAAKRDFDRFDAICDHLLVIDTKRTDLPGGVVGTYRLLREQRREPERRVLHVGRVRNLADRGHIGRDPRARAFLR